MPAWWFIGRRRWTPQTGCNCFIGPPHSQQTHITKHTPIPTIAAAGKRSNAGATARFELVTERFCHSRRPSPNLAIYALSTSPCQYPPTSFTQYILYLLLCLPIPSWTYSPHLLALILPPNEMRACAELTPLLRRPLAIPPRSCIRRYRRRALVVRCIQTSAATPCRRPAVGNLQCAKSGRARLALPASFVGGQRRRASVAASTVENGAIT